MAENHTNLLIQIVFAVNGRESLIHPPIKDELEKYICSIVSAEKSKPLAIFCNPNHLHLLLNLHPTMALSELVRIIKSNSAKWLNQKFFINAKFSWQGGYGAFSYSKDHLAKVATYIENQETHHQNHSFRDEYLDFLHSENLSFNPDYLFKDPD